MKVKTLLQGRWTIYAACSERGVCELEEFLNEIPPNMKKSAENLMALLTKISFDGPQGLSDESSHKIDGEIWEFIRGRLRVLWFYQEGKVVVCSHAFVKDTQKTPKREIKKAKKALYQAGLEGLEMVGELAKVLGE